MQKVEVRCEKCHKLLFCLVSFGKAQAVVEVKCTRCEHKNIFALDKIVSISHTLNREPETR
jgi:phage FluMu protein Com